MQAPDQYITYPKVQKTSISAQFTSNDVKIQKLNNLQKYVTVLEPLESKDPPGSCIILYRYSDKIEFFPFILIFRVKQQRHVSLCMCEYVYTHIYICAHKHIYKEYFVIISKCWCQMPPWRKKHLCIYLSQFL